MTMPEILRRKLMERIDIASEPDDGEVLEEIDRLILGGNLIMMYSVTPFGFG